ncbi:molybdopterin-dependent oxidoreductase [Nocardia sp. ET3-3]|uniref:Molybdopterin-dependent oxidoreductase n=1 Tax=Nocardia terrae TaxID=2675851 RepID=A0A7K1V810_9NOCA|nr:molybdopterin oxidoreductase family protein [Nocardia terrae]MVU82612.1 molybdopterin-dependent oxidoreductase [Nocardia terrae]
MTGPRRIRNPWGERSPYARGARWPVRVDLCLTEGVEVDNVDRWVPSASVLHSNGDAFDIAVRGDRIVGVRGRANDRVNRGRLDPKDLFGWQANASPDRLTTPLVREDGQLVEADWDTAMDRIVGRTRELLDGPGPDAIGFYTSGQLFLEEYYTLTTLARAGIGTNHLDGNTRLCTATAAESLKQSFGCDGQPGSYTDIDHADVITLYGHNVAETQSVLWSRILDRLAGPQPPALVCVDPRRTPVAAAATVHLAVLPGTNVALMNGLIHELIERDWIDHDYIDTYTIGFDELAKMVADWPAVRAAAVCGIDEDELRLAANVIGTADHLVSTVLQGFYQAHQATAAAVQVNNIHLLRGMLGRAGCGVLQMNGQPTAQNTRECGADGDLPGFRNWANRAHLEDLARVWNVEVDKLDHGKPPTDVMQMMDLAESGDLRMLWVSATNPAVSLPELARIRRILNGENLFLVVQDLFPTETTELADVVLPAAGWGEKTGTFTNADRTVHLSEQAVPPPGQARSDLAIFLDFARRLDLRDRSGELLPGWDDPAGAFRAWQDCSAGRPCDYTGLDYRKLRDQGIQWPCNSAHPDGAERLYADGAFFATPDSCETYGKDLVTGEPAGEAAYRERNPHGRAMLEPAPYLLAPESCSADYPLALITGRTVYHFHTRTKTGRVPRLQAAAPEVWAEISELDAAANGIVHGDRVRVISPRGEIIAAARITDIRPGVVFVPFHYGYWDTSDGTHRRAANELTRTDWDPVSKQPSFKSAAVRLVPWTG